jgi:predicted transcriptional regulator
MNQKLKEVRLEVVPTVHRKLKQLSRDEGSSIAVIVRRAINQFLERNETTKAGE